MGSVDKVQRKKMYQDVQSEIRKQGFDPLDPTQSYKRPIKLTKEGKKISRVAEQVLTAKREDYTPILEKPKKTQELFGEIDAAVEGSLDIIKGVDRGGLNPEEFRGGLRDIRENKPTERAKQVMDVRAVLLTLT